MTTLTAEKAQLEIAETADVLAVLRSSYELWGCDMSRQDYADWTSMQSQTFWWRKHVRFFVLRSAGKIVCSCKFYRLTMQSRGREFKIGGVGAVYTMPEYRGRGHASQMLASIKQMAKQEGYDALLLYSDIDPSFYEDCGYQLLSDHEFYLWLNDEQCQQRILRDPSFAEDLHDHETEVGQICPEVVPAMVASYNRYIPAVPWAIQRDEHYWSYKLAREIFLQSHPLAGRPPLEYLSIELDRAGGGYVIFEHFDKILRVLEVVGRADARQTLWRNLLRAAMLRRVQLIRGWEAVAPSFLKGIRYISRDAARPMLLPLSDEAAAWVDIRPCPLLELDHF